MNSDETIIAALAGDDPEKMLQEWIFRHVSELKDEIVELKAANAELTERVEILEQYQEPVRQITDQLKKRLIQALVLIIVLSLLGTGGIIYGA